MSDNSGKLYGVQYLRGFAAMLVVLWHTAWLIGPEWKLALKHSFIGVDIFLLSAVSLFIWPQIIKLKQMLSDLS